MLLGSEGILGVITEAWVRAAGPAALQGVGGRHASPTSRAGAEAVRALSQSGLYPDQLPPARPGRGGADRSVATEGGALLVLGFESADHPVEPWMDRALELCRRPRGRRRRRREPAADRRTDSVGAWREAFLRAPYLRDMFVALRRDQRHVRDRDHVGPLRRRSTRR